MEYSEVAQLALDQTNEARRIEYLVKSSEFSSAWHAAIPGARDIVAWHIKKGDRKEVLKWLEHHHTDPHCEKTWTGLMKEAKRCCIKNYSRMTRAELIVALESYDRRKNEANSRHSNRKGDYYKDYLWENLFCDCKIDHG